MSYNPASGVPALGGLMDSFRSWLHDWFVEPEIGLSGPQVHDYGAVRVLVADDNPVNLMLISALLESRGLVPLLAADCAEAVALACELPFDLILMDLQMPILDGLRATAAIRRFESKYVRPAVPVLAYASSLPAWDLMAKFGISGSLNKPCQDQDLDACLARWCPTYRSAPALRAEVRHQRTDRVAAR